MASSTNGSLAEFSFLSVLNVGFAINVTFFVTLFPALSTALNVYVPPAVSAILP